MLTPSTGAGAHGLRPRQARSLVLSTFVMSFHHSVTARFSEIDRAGIVFFGRYFEYCHAAFEELLARMFGDLEQSFAAGLWTMPLVHAEADFARPVRLGDRLD